jgi:hypothetical protein
MRCEHGGNFGATRGAMFSVVYLWYIIKKSICTRWWPWTPQHPRAPHHAHGACHGLYPLPLLHSSFLRRKKGIFPDVHVVCSSVHAKDREARPPHEPGMHLAVHDALDFGYGKSTSRLRDSNTHALRDAHAWSVLPGDPTFTVSSSLPSLQRWWRRQGRWKSYVWCW